jgi:hypothetical protein
MRRAALLALVLSTPLIVACGRVQARTPPPAPPAALDVPTPPTPLLVPVSDPVDPVKDPTDPTPPAARPTPPPTRPVSSPPAAPPPPPPDAPTPVVQTSSNAGELEHKTRELLEAADRDLNRLSEETLKGGAPQQYRSARRFVQMAKEALEHKNYLYAHATAQKAAAMAGLLVRRLPTAL